LKIPFNLQEEARKAAAIAELEAQSGGLFKRLQGIASSGVASSGSAGSTSGSDDDAARVVGAASTPGRMLQQAARASVASNGNGAAGGGVAAAAAVSASSDGSAQEQEEPHQDLTAQYVRLYGQAFALDKQMFLNRQVVHIKLERRSFVLVLRRTYRAFGHLDEACCEVLPKVGRI
jgi:hypothetical protein